MIVSFRHKGLEDFHYDATRKGIQPKHADKLSGILDMLEAATTIQDLNFPGSGLHQLQPKKENRWAIKVSGNWRVTFRFERGEVYEVDYEDYH
ncbi:MAG: type II toxin-antitoxin system RelE/ParE family toxin [Anaerolineae bacterium]